MTNLAEQLFTGWSFMRWLRLGLGIFIGVQAFMSRDGLAGLVSLFLLYQVWVNTGCCGVERCAVPTPKTEDVEFEKIEKP